MSPGVALNHAGYCHVKHQKLNLVPALCVATPEIIFKAQLKQEGRWKNLLGRFGFILRYCLFHVMLTPTHSRHSLICLGCAGLGGGVSQLTFR